MTAEEFEKEKTYQVLMGIARTALGEGIITEEEYGRVEEKMAERYKPVLGTLFSDIRLNA